MRRLAALLTTVAAAGLSACGALPMDTTPAAMRHAGFVQREVVVDGRSHRYQVLVPAAARSEEHTSELQSLMRISYAVFRFKKKKPETVIQPMMLSKILY